ncbi:MAG: alpha/beta hydrolase [Deltaproteobacteria bacterium]|nr:alpha/beta hydrolase [Deltaproteobacteria bacterium]
MNIEDPLANVQLHSEINGCGHPLLFLHGFGTNTHSWRYLVGTLSTSHQTIALDLKGFGASPKPLDAAYSIYDQAALVREFILQHDLWDITLIGHSFGGAVALATLFYFSEEERRRISRLILIDALAYRQDLPVFISILTTPILGFAALNLLPNTWQAKFCLMYAYHDSSKITDDTVALYATPLNTPGAQHALTQTAYQLLPIDANKLSDQYKQINFPVLIIWGQHDHIIPLEAAHRLNKDIPNSELVILKESGHMPFEEQPQETLSAMVKFLNKAIPTSR